VKAADHRHTVSHLSLLSAPELACIAMHTLFGLCLHEPNGVKFFVACMNVGRAANLEVKLNAIKANKQEWRAMKQALAPTGSATVGASAQVSESGTSASGSPSASGPSSSSPSGPSQVMSNVSFQLSPAAMGE